MKDTFSVAFSSRAQKDLSGLPAEIQNVILNRMRSLERDPFPCGNMKKKIKGMRHPLFRLRINTRTDSFRVFYAIHRRAVLVLRIIPRKDADKILKSFRP